MTVVKRADKLSQRAHAHCSPDDSYHSNDVKFCIDLTRNVTNCFIIRAWQTSFFNNRLMYKSYKILFSSRWHTTRIISPLDIMFFVATKVVNIAEIMHLRRLGGSKN